MKKYAMPVIMLAVFETAAITLWLTKDNLFCLFNFSYIGLLLSSKIGNKSAYANSAVYEE